MKRKYKKLMKTHFHITFIILQSTHQMNQRIRVKAIAIMQSLVVLNLFVNVARKQPHNDARFAASNYVLSAYLKVTIVVCIGTTMIHLTSPQKIKC